MAAPIKLRTLAVAAGRLAAEVLWYIPGWFLTGWLRRRLPRREVVIWINPRCILLSIPRPVPRSYVAAGEWSERTRPFWQVSRRMQLVRECLEYEDAGRDFRTAPLLADWKEQISRGIFIKDNDGREIDTHEKAVAIVRHYLAIFRSVASCGYDPALGRPFIGVAIGRGGTVLKAGDGRHRLGACQLAGVPLVPVVVKHVHDQWLRSAMGKFSRIPVLALRRGLAEVEARHRAALPPEEEERFGLPRIRLPSGATGCESGGMTEDGLPVKAGGSSSP